MHVDEAQLERVNAKLNNQHAIKAAIGAAIWSIPLLLTWYGVYYFAPDFSPMMLFLAGVGLGFAVRVHGHGYRRRFALIALVAYVV